MLTLTIIPLTNSINTTMVNGKIAVNDAKRNATFIVENNEETIHRMELLQGMNYDPMADPIGGEFFSIVPGEVVELVMTTEGHLAEVESRIGFGKNEIAFRFENNNIKQLNVIHEDDSYHFIVEIGETEHIFSGENVEALVGRTKLLAA